MEGNADGMACINIMKFRTLKTDSEMKKMVTFKSKKKNWFLTFE